MAMAKFFVRSSLGKKKKNIIAASHYDGKDDHPGTTQDTVHSNGHSIGTPLTWRGIYCPKSQ